MVGLGEGLVDQHLAVARRVRQPARAQHDAVHAWLAIRRQRDQARRHRLAAARQVEQPDARDARLDAAHARQRRELAREAIGRAHHAGGQVGHARRCRSSRRARAAANRTCRWPSRTATMPQASTAPTAAACIFMRDRSRSSLRSSGEQRAASPVQFRGALPLRRCVRCCGSCPSAKRTTRSPICAMSALCVISSVVVPSVSFAVTSASSTRMPVATSSAPVGSSHSSTVGRLAMARAMATRCCSPPESCAGKCAARSRQADQRQRLGGRHRVVGHLGDEFDVLARGEARDQVVELEHEADVVAPVAP